LSDPLIVHSAFDEAGDTGKRPGSSRHLVVAGIVSTDMQSVRRIVLRTRKSMGKKRRQIPELKAWHTPPGLTAKLLNRLSKLEIEIYAAILDKRSAKSEADPEEWYRTLYAESIRQALSYRSRLIVTMDKHYTNAALRDRLVSTIVARAQSPGTTLSFVMTDSRNETMLQAVDAVAWSIFQKYEREEEMFYKLIEGKIRGEIKLLR